MTETEKQSAHISGNIRSRSFYSSWKKVPVGCCFIKYEPTHKAKDDAKAWMQKYQKKIRVINVETKRWSNADIYDPEGHVTVWYEIER